MTRPLVMGIVNVTPDSFSDGGRWAGVDEALRHGRTLASQGAEIIDVGGESTRPGAERPSTEEELARVLPVVRGLAAERLQISIDTMRAEVARAAVSAGARLINDVSGGLADPQMAAVAAESDATYIAMHWRGHSAGMQDLTAYRDVVADVCHELTRTVDRLLQAGVRSERLVVDPGFGFAKTKQQNWELLARMGEFDVHGLPVLWGTSRKSFLGEAGTTSDVAVLPPAERDAATAATSVIAAQHRAWGVRVHDVPSTLAALDVVAYLSAQEASR